MHTPIHHRSCERNVLYLTFLGWISIVSPTLATIDTVYLSASDNFCEQQEENVQAEKAGMMGRLWLNIGIFGRRPIFGKLRGRHMFKHNY